MSIKPSHAMFSHYDGEQLKGAGIHYVWNEWSRNAPLIEMISLCSAN